MKYLIPLFVFVAAGLNATGIAIVDGVYDSSIQPAARVFRVYYDSSHSISDPTMPIAVFIHGGAWAGGSYGAALGKPDSLAPGICSDTLTVLCDLASRGYAVYSIDYTLTAGGAPENKWPVQWQDCECFLKFLAEQAGVTVPGNAQHILMMGHSAGAHLATITTLAPHDAFPTNCTHTSVNYAIDAVVAASPPDDLVAVYAASVVSSNHTAADAISSLLGCRPVSHDPACVQKARTASPTNYVSQGQPPVLVESGMGDETIPFHAQGHLQAAYAALSPPVLSQWIIYGHDYGHDLDLFDWRPCALPFQEPSPCGSRGAAYKDIQVFSQGVSFPQPVTFTTLSNFDGSAGSMPEFVALVQGLDGNLYGTASQGGTFSLGTVFQVTPSGALTAIYNFDSTHGAVPFAGLTLGNDGNFYGTTSQGGANNLGTVFQITPRGALTTLHSFNGTDGANPETALVQASDGHFYGSTYQGGAYGKGTLFRISATGVFASGHTFQFLPHPLGALVQGTDGNLYGTTMSGGPKSCGTFFRFHPSGEFDGEHNFNCTEASHPEAALVLAPDAKFYGTSPDGGIGFGALFNVGVGGGVTPFHSFDGSTEGSQPVSPLILATDGKIYGTTSSGGTCANGTIFKVTPAGALTTMHTLCDGDGMQANGGLVQHTNGTLYGVTMGGGTNNLGTIFSLNVGLNPSVKTLPTSGSIGSPVTILGTNLAGATSVSFNSTPAKFAVLSSSEITTTVPVGATTGKVQVATPDGTLSSNVKFGVAP